jgi:carbonic anhydrase
MSEESYLNLVEGYKKFYRKYQGSNHDEYREEAAIKQDPKVMVISCSDSRVSPSIVTRAKLGEIFLVCNVANIVPPFRPGKGTHHSTSSALEFAVGTLEIEHIVVMGHSGCGGIRALIDGAPEAPDGEYSFIKPWVNIVENAKKRVKALPKEEQYYACEQEALKISLENLRSFPWIEEKIVAKKLFIHAWHFDIPSGVMSYYNPEKDIFLPLMESD